jgi:hypothetical protein
MKRKFILIILSLIVTLSLSSIVIYFTDAFGLWNQRNAPVDYLMYSSQPIQNAIKLKSKYDIALIGMSRMQRIDPRNVGSSTEKKVINVAISGGHNDEFLVLAKDVKNNHKNFVYEISYDSIPTYISCHQTKKKMVTAYSESVAKSFFNLFFSADILLATIDVAYHKVFLKESTTTMNHGNEDSNEVSANEAEIIQAGLICDKARNLEYVFDKTKLSELIELSDQNDIFVIFPKYSAESMIKKESGTDMFNQFIAELVLKTNAKVWDFNTINSITNDKYNFDRSGGHFKPKIGKLIFARIFDEKNITVPADFGILVTKDNINQYIALSNEQRRKWEISHSKGMEEIPNDLEVRIKK